jgi:hypothetical protein
MSSRGVPVVLAGLSATLLAGYFAVATWAWLSPSTDPQRGMAQGFLALFTLGLLGLAGLLWLGVRAQRAGLVWLVFGVCALPSLSFVARGIYLLVRWLQRG